VAIGRSASPTDDEPSLRQVPNQILGIWPPLSAPVCFRKAVDGRSCLPGNRR